MCLFLSFEDSASLSLPCVCFCVSDAPVKTQHFVPQTHRSVRGSQNDMYANTFYICKCAAVTSTDAVTKGNARVRGAQGPRVGISLMFDQNRGLKAKMFLNFF